MRTILISFIGLAVAVLMLQTAEAQEKSSSLGKPVFPKLEYVDLNTELGFQSEILRGYGAQVDDARRDADAEALAAHAVLLSFAEEMAGKSAQTITAIKILEEAVRIAEEQQNRRAARVIVAAARRIPGGDAIAQNMNSSLALFSEKRGEGDFIGYIKIVNECDRILDIYIDGKYCGFLYGKETNTYYTGNGTTISRVTDAFGNTVSEVLYVNPDETFTWTIKP